jgi:hypothetical protein
MVPHGLLVMRAGRYLRVHFPLEGAVVRSCWGPVRLLATPERLGACGLRTRRAADLDRLVNGDHLSNL